MGSLGDILQAVDEGNGRWGYKGSWGDEEGAHKKPRENISTVTIFCFFLNFNLITEGSGSAKMTKSMTVDMTL